MWLFLARTEHQRRRIAGRAVLQCHEAGCGALHLPSRVANIAGTSLYLAFMSYPFRSLVVSAAQRISSVRYAAPS